MQSEPRLLSLCPTSLRHCTRISGMLNLQFIDYQSACDTAAQQPQRNLPCENMWLSVWTKRACRCVFSWARGLRPIRTQSGPGVRVSFHPQPDRGRGAGDLQQVEGVQVRNSEFKRISIKRIHLDNGHRRQISDDDDDDDDHSKGMYFSVLTLCRPSVSPLQLPGMFLSIQKCLPVFVSPPCPSFLSEVRCQPKLKLTTWIKPSGWKCMVWTCTWSR